MSTADEVTELVIRGLDPENPVVFIDGEQIGLELEEFFRSLASEKTTDAKWVTLKWRINDFDLPIAEGAFVRVLIESMTQVYLSWPREDQDERSEQSVANSAGWAFTGRPLAEGGFDPSPDADCTRVRGFIEVFSHNGTPLADQIWFQVVDRSLELPPNTFPTL